MSKRKILLADGHTIVLDGLRKILDPEYDVVGEVKDGRALVVAADKLRPDVIAVDIGMPVLNALEAIRQLAQADLRAKIIFMTMHASVEFAVEAFRPGASGYLLKHDASDELLRAIREVLNGRFDETSVQLEPGDRLYFFLDGVTEAANERDEMLDTEGIIELIEGTRTSSSTPGA